MAEEGQLAGGQLNAALAAAVVRIHNRYLGRGPSKGQAFFRDRVVVVIMEETLTKPSAAWSTPAAGTRSSPCAMAAELFVLDRPVPGEPTASDGANGSEGSASTI